MGMDNLNYFIGTELFRQFHQFVGYNEFTDEELLKLKTLNISTTTSIVGISKLMNLEELNILFYDPVEYSYDVIIDYSELSNLRQLKSLIIANNAHIKKLDLSSFENLERLILVSNVNLEEIIGLEKLKKLTRVVIVGNNIKHIPNIKEYIKNTQNTAINILDYKIFFSIYNEPSNYKFLSDVELTYDTNLTFAEKIGIGEIFTYSFNMINKVNKIAELIIENVINEDMTVEEKVHAIYCYVVEHLTYDYERLEKRADYVHNSHKIPTYDNNHKYINSSYEAFISGKVICEGYVNMLNFLLNKLNIESRTVYCVVKNSKDYSAGYYDHSSIAIKLNDEWYYFDAQLENDSIDLKYFKKTREEFSETHEFSPSSQVLKLSQK